MAYLPCGVFGAKIRRGFLTAGTSAGQMAAGKSDGGVWLAAMPLHPCNVFGAKKKAGSHGGWHISGTDGGRIK